MEILETRVSMELSVDEAEESRFLWECWVRAFFVRSLSTAEWMRCDLAIEVEGARSRGVYGVRAEKTCVPYRG